MTLHDSPDDPRLVALASWLRAHPEEWSHSDVEPMSDERMATLIGDVIARIAADELAARRRRRRRMLLGGACAAIAISGGVAAASVLLPRQPTVPHEGALCRAEAEAGSSAIAVDLGRESIEECRALWEEGRFEELGVTGPIPPLAACLGPGGVIEVFPGDDSVCTELGLDAAGLVLSAENAAIVDLQERLIDEVNSKECVTVEDAATLAQDLLNASSLVGWTVETPADVVAGTCGTTAIDPSRRVIIIVNL